MKLFGALGAVALTLLGTSPLWAQSHTSHRTSAKLTRHSGRRFSSAPNASLKKWVRPTYGFSLGLAGNWKDQPTSDLHDFFSCALRDKRGKVRQALVVQMSETQSPNLHELAAQVVKNGGGKISQEALKLDGHQAINLTTNTDPSHWAHQQILVSTQGKQTFTLVLSGITGENLDGTRKQILRNWRWIPFAAPTSHLQFNSAPNRVAGGQITLKLPELMRTMTTAAQDSSFGIFDARTGISALVLNVNILPNTQPLTIAQMRQKFNQRLQQSIKLPHPPSWQDKAAKGSSPARTLCVPFEVKDLTRMTGHQTLVSYGVAKMPGNRWALFTFNITGQSPQDLKRYTTLIGKIFDTVELHPVKA